MFDRASWRKQADIICGVLEKAPSFDKEYRLPPSEFSARQKKVMKLLEENGADCGIVYSDEHYCGDVPYLAGNNNIIVEPIAAVISPKGLYFIAGLESGIVAEQFCHRSGVNIRRVDILKIDNLDAQAGQLTPDMIIEEACGHKPLKIALLTTKAVFPTSLYSALKKYAGEESIVDLSEAYYEIKYEKSDLEMKLIEESCLISDTIMEGMLRVLRPGLYETQLAQWGYAMACEMGVEDMGFKIMVTAGKSNKTFVGQATNNIIKEGDIVHVGISPKRDGLCGAQRASVMCVRNPSQVTEGYKLWMDFLEGAFAHAVTMLKKVASQQLPGGYHEKSMIDYYSAKAPELAAKTGLDLRTFSDLKGYVSTHNSGYTECQEFYGALSCDFAKPLANQMVLMIDTGLKGFGENWNDIVIPDIDYIVIEKTTGIFGKDVRILNKLPANLQYFVSF